MTKLTGKTAIVTGGSRGIGRAIVELFSENGARVLTCGRGNDPGDLPSGVAWQTADVSKAESVAGLYAAAMEDFGRIDVLVNNAGIQIEKTVADSSDADWDNLMGVNAKGVFLMCRQLIPVMEKQGGGTIINIGSISGSHADPSLALYNASKSFVNGLTRSIAVDHGQQGIRCNAICPGWIMTEMAEEGYAMAENPETAKADALRRHPVGRFGQPLDIANAAVWLASKDSEFMTGQTLTVDGGLVAASPLQPSLF
jgi:meso-butanediol dehydrogenase/(S,S)-butanediol dehydrogenase/diacetyl reductase